MLQFHTLTSGSGPVLPSSSQIEVKHLAQGPLNRSWQGKGGCHSLTPAKLVPAAASNSRNKPSFLTFRMLSNPVFSGSDANWQLSHNLVVLHLKIEFLCHEFSTLVKTKKTHLYKVLWGAVWVQSKCNPHWKNFMIIPKFLWVSKKKEDIKYLTENNIQTRLDTTHFFSVRHSFVLVCSL